LSSSSSSHKDSNEIQNNVVSAMKEDTDKAVSELRKLPFKGQKLMISLAKPKRKENGKEGEEGGDKPAEAPKPKPQPRPKPKLIQDPQKVHEPGAKEARVVLRNLEFSASDCLFHKSTKHSLLTPHSLLVQ
jgi:hypothetical protein